MMSFVFFLDFMVTIQSLNPRFYRILGCSRSGKRLTECPRRAACPGDIYQSIIRLPITRGICDTKGPNTGHPVRQTPYTNYLNPEGPLPEDKERLVSAIATALTKAESSFRTLFIGNH